MAFSNIKQAIKISLLLTNPYFEQDFILYSLVLNENIVPLLTQTNTKGEELPILFMRKTLHDYELKYLDLRK